MEGATGGLEVVQALEALRGSLLAELQELRDKMEAMEERVEYLVLDRLQQEDMPV